MKVELEDLRHNLQVRNLVLLVGSGLSIGAGLPSWYQLIAELARRISYNLPPVEWVNADGLIQCAQAYVNRHGLQSLISYLKEVLDTTHIRLTAAHDALASAPIGLVFTTNYDDLLERAFRNKGKKVHVVTKDIDISFMRDDPDWVNIVKLYGDLSEPGTIIFTRQQYEGFFLEKPQMVKLLETELTRRLVLYAGYGHRDPHFGLILGELLDRFKEFSRSSYMFVSEASPDELEELKRKRVQPIQLDPTRDRTQQLAEWLLAIQEDAS